MTWQRRKERKRKEQRQLKQEELDKATQDEWDIYWDNKFRGIVIYDIPDELLRDNPIVDPVDEVLYTLRDYMQM